jgi:hypothetical protein
MWIFTPNSFLSIVAPTPGTPAQRNDCLVVRGRVKGDIELIFPHAIVSNTPNRDYAFRAVLPRAEVAAAVAMQVFELNYTNFKNSIKEEDRHTAAHRVWAVMNELQDTRGHGGLYNDPNLWYDGPGRGYRRQRK